MGLRWRQNGKEPKGNIGRYDEASWAGSMLQVSLFACEPPRRGREEEGRGITFLHYLGLSKAVRISQDQARVLIS